MKNNKRESHVMMPYTSNGGHPNRVIAVDTETHPRIDDPEIHELTLGWYMIEDILNKRQGAKHYRESEFTTTDEFWNVVEEVCTAEKKVTITALNMGGFDNKVLEMEAQLIKRGWEIVSLIIPKPFMIHARQECGIKKDGKPRYRRMDIVDLTNFYAGKSVKMIGQSLGMPKGDPAGGPAHPRYFPINGCIPGSREWYILSKYCKQDTLIVLRAFEKYVKFCIENELGPWRETISGQALTAWVQKYLDPVVPIMYIHNNAKALKLERESYHGAVTDAWRIGQYAEENGFWYHDVNSLYPSVMRKYTYPVKFIGRRKGIAIAPTKEERIELAKVSLENGMGVIARVLIDTTMSDKPEQELRLFPVIKIGEDKTTKLVFPVGRIKTVLTSREIELALELGIIYDIVEMSTYEMLPIFVEYVDFFYALKNKYKAEGNIVYFDIAKLFLNGLYGKWAQHNPEWIPIEGNVMPEGMNVIVHVMPDDTKVTIRKFADRQEQTNGLVKESYNSFPGLAAHITADARLTLFKYRQIAGVDHSYYGDTDSLLTDYQGHINLENANVLNETELGLLKTEDKNLEQINIIAPKTYQKGNKPWVRKGIRKDAQELWIANSNGDITPSGEVFWQIQFEGFGGAMRFGNVNEARIMVKKKTLANTYGKGIIGEDGWIKPFTMEMWSYDL